VEVAWPGRIEQKGITLRLGPSGASGKRGVTKDRIADLLEWKETSSTEKLAMRNRRYLR